MRNIRHLNFRVKQGEKHSQPSAAAPWWLCLPLLIAFMLIASAPAFAKGGDPLTNFPYIHAVAGKQEAMAMTVDHAGNVIVVGTTRPAGDDDYFVAKFKADGSGMSWTPASFGSTGNDVATAVTVDSKDNIIVTGYTVNGADIDIHTIKYCGSATPATDCPPGKQTPGAVIWEHTLANPLGNDYATAIAVDGSDNIYVAGSYFNGAANDDFLVIKYPSAGSTPTWTEIYDDPANANKINKILAIAVDSSGFTVTGYSGRGATFDILTRKYDLNRTLIRQWRHSDSGISQGKAVKLDKNGNVIVTGSITNALSNTDIYTVKYNPASDTPVWEKIYSDNGTDDPKGLWVDSTVVDGDVYVTGVTHTLSGNDDFVTMRYDGAIGSLKWKTVFDAGNGAIDIPSGIVVDGAADGGVFVTGYTTVPGNDDIITLKYNKANGGLLWKNIWTGNGNKNNRAVGIGLDSSRNAVVAGWADNAATGYNFLAFKYDFGAINAPTNLTAGAASNTSITLNWSDNSSNEEKFVIERKAGEGGTWATLTTTPATLGPGTITYTDTGLNTNSYYYYRLRAYNTANGYSDYSNEAHALTKVVSYDTSPWNYLYTGADNLDDVATAITFDPADNNPVVSGYSELNEQGTGLPSYDYMTVKLDRTDKSVKWKARYDSGDGGTDMAAGVALDGSGNVLVTGTSYLQTGGSKSDEIYTIKVATAGLNDQNATPAFMWDNQYGTQDHIDVSTTITMAKDASNNSVVIGYGRNAANNDDAFIIKLDNNGTRVFTPIVYDSGRHEQPTAVAFDPAGNIFVTGYSFNTSSPAGSYDWFTAKYNGTTGAQIWVDTFNSGYGDDKALSLDVDSAGNAYVTGQAKNSAGNSVIYTIKYDGAQPPAGQRRIWEKSFNYAGFDARAVSVRVDQIDGQVVVGGTVFVNANDSDFHLIRYNSADGTVIWDRNFDRPTGPKNYDYAVAMVMDSSGYIYLAGNTRSGPDTDQAYDDSSDIMSIIYDYEGTFLGASIFDGTAHKKDSTAAITVNNKGEAFIAGTSQNAANSDYAVVKQVNGYYLAPAPFTAIGEADCTKVDLTWAQNNPGSSFRIERTAGPSYQGSVWTLVQSPNASTTNWTDSGLTSGTSYCYRIDTIKSDGSLNSRKLEKCVTTTLPAPATVSFTVDSANQITLNWSDVTGNTGYKIERKITVGGTWDFLITKSAGVTSHIDSGLTPGTVYYYRVSAANVGGYSLPATSTAATTKPAAPILSAPSGITSSQAILSWSNVTGETGFSLERKTGSGGTWGEVCTKGADILTCTDAGLSANTQYYYRATAYNGSGYSDYSNEQPVLSLFQSPTLTSATFDSVTPTQINLVWSDVGAATYTIERSTCNFNGNTAYDVTYCTAAYLGTDWSGWSTIGTTSSTGFSYNSGHTNGGNAYTYRITANHAPNSSSPSNVIIAWTSLTPPTVSVDPGSTTSLVPKWNNILGATNYTVERKLGTGGTWAEVPAGTGLNKDAVNFTDNGLSLSTQYCYRVRAYSTLPNPPASVYGTYSDANNCLYTPLAAPTLNALSAAAVNQVDLAWNSVSGATGYDVQMRTMISSYNNYPSSYWSQEYAWGSWSTVATGLPTSPTSWSKTGLQAGYTYQFQVRDTYPGGNSAWSNAQWITTIPPAPGLTLTPVSISQIDVSWSDVYAETSYKLEWKPRSGGDCTAGTWNGPFTIAQDGTGYSHTGLSTNTYYCYRAYSVNGSGNSPYSTAVSQTTLLDPPTFNAPTGITNAKIDLSWSQMTNNTGYRLERKTGYAGTWAAVAGANPLAQDLNSFSNSGLTTGTNYFYRVSTRNAGGYSIPSSELSVTTTAADVVITPTAVSDDEIDLCWPVTLGATSYKVDRKEGSGGTYGPVSEKIVDYGTSYCGSPYPSVACPSATAMVYCMQDTGLKANTQYYYHVHSANGTDSAGTNEVSKTTLSIPNQNLVATPLDGGFMIQLDWTPVPCAPIACNNPDNFEIQRLLREGIWLTLNTVGGTTLTYTDKNAIEPNKRYRYRVRSLKGALQSPYSEATVISKPYSAGANVCR